MAAKLVHLWQQELVIQYVHISVDWEMDGSEVGPSYHPQDPPLVAYGCQLEPTFKIFYHFPNLPQQLETKYLNTWGCGEYIIFKP